MFSKTNSQKERIRREDWVWLNEEGLVCVYVRYVATEDDVRYLLGELKKKMVLTPGETRVLVDMSEYPLDSMRSSQSRRMIAEEAKKLVEEVGLKKVAMFGRSMTTRTIAAFVIVASGLKNVKIFPTREKAIKWLKEP